MNIHFTDKELFYSLIDNTVFSTKIGSHMYGLDTSESDKDYLYVYLEDTDNNNSFMWEHHQLQYNEEDKDIMFVTLQNLIRNALTGDSTINFELIHSDVIKNSSLQWLWERRNYFINYNIIRSYLGLARRDLKFWRKFTNNGKKHTDETNKKLSHFVRGVIFAYNLMSDNFSLNLKNTTTYEESGLNDYDLVLSIKHGFTSEHFVEYVLYFEMLMDNLRDDLNNKLNNHKIYKFMSEKNLKDLDKNLKNFIKIYSMNYYFSSLNYGDIFYTALENGIQY